MGGPPASSYALARSPVLLGGGAIVGRRRAIAATTCHAYGCSMPSCERVSGVPDVNAAQHCCGAPPNAESGARRWRRSNAECASMILIIERSASPMAGKSGAIFNLVKADGLVCIPASAEGLEEGTEVEVILF